MKKFFAKLDGDIVGIDAYIRFEAFDKKLAQEFADTQAEENYGSYDDPYDEEGCPNFHANVEEYVPEKHDEYFSHINTNEFEILV
jgi:hypothetical protein